MDEEDGRGTRAGSLTGASLLRRRLTWVLLALAVLTSIGVWAVQSPPATHVVRVGWLARDAVDVPARALGGATDLDVGLTLELDIENVHLELWDGHLLRGAVVLQEGVPVGIVQEAELKRAGLLDFLANGEMVSRARAQVGPFPDVDALLASARDAGGVPPEWTTLEDTPSPGLAEMVWVLSAWGDVARGEAAVVLGSGDDRIVLGSAGGWGVHFPDRVRAVATAADRVSSVVGTPSGDEIGQFVGGVVAVEDGVWIATTRAMPPGIVVEVVVDGLGADVMQCRYRVGSLGPRETPLDGLRQALRACGIDQSHYYTPLRVQVSLDAAEPVLLLAETSSLGSSSDHAVRMLQEHLNGVVGETPPELIRITISRAE